jgi:hypothetical protein
LSIIVLSLLLQQLAVLWCLYGHSLATTIIAGSTESTCHNISCVLMHWTLATQLLILFLLKAIYLAATFFWHLSYSYNVCHSEGGYYGNLENGCSTFLENISELLSDYRLSHCRI